MKKILATVLLLALLLPCTALGEGALRVVSLSPSATEVLVDLGAGDLLVGVDYYSVDVLGIPADLPVTGGLTDPDAELLLALSPDLIFISEMSNLEMFAPLASAGVEIIWLPSSESIEAIAEDNLTIGRAVDMEAEALALNAAMMEVIEGIREIGEGIQERRKVYFELSAAPYLYSLGSGTFVDELIGIAGGVNIFADQESWLNISEEAVLEGNPDVILTSVHYLEDAVEEILARPGWEAITAVAEGRVVLVNGDTTSRPNHRVALALAEIAQAIYPEYYE